ncbi:hypothetical protein ABBQ38_001279 [Trebouxia sp. C0009 RCD-2024]
MLGFVNAGRVHPAQLSLHSRSSYIPGPATRRISCLSDQRASRQPIEPAAASAQESSGEAREHTLSKKQPQSSWNAKRAGADADSPSDFLSNLGEGQDYNINVDHGQNVQQIDSLFVGDILGKKSDIADGSLRDWDFRKFEHLVGDYYVAPKFLDAMALHITKNYMAEKGCFASKIKVPLIMGIWGPKGQGKSFQAELVFKKMGIEPIIMSAGELEHEWAGTPGRLIRERYRKAAEVSRVRGKMSCLLINDIDAGLGHFANTQVTVNNQIVVGTLMNLCDDPNRVSVYQVWRDSDFIQRVPIIVTGNDLSHMFAPLIRDGRMSKFYWKPDRVDLSNILHQMYKDDGLSFEDMGVLLDMFPQQPLDFFGALRSAVYDDQIRDWIQEDVLKNKITDEDANLSEVSRRLVSKKGLPVFNKVEVTLDGLVAQGRRLAQEQQMVNEHKLSQDYLKDTGPSQPGLIGLKG